MTLLHLLTLLCLFMPIGAGIDAGKDLGLIGIMLGIGIGAVVGGLAYIVLKRSVYSEKFFGSARFKTQTRQRLTETAAVIWIILLLGTAAVLAGFSTDMIVQRISG